MSTPVKQSIAKRFSRSIFIMLCSFFLILVSCTLAIELFRIHQSSKSEIQVLGKSTLQIIEERFEAVQKTIKNTAESSLFINSLIDVTGSKSYVEHTLANLVRNTNIHEAMVFDFKGQVIGMNSNTPPEWFKASFIRTSFSTGFERVTFEDKKFIMVFPIRYYNTLQGAIAVSVKPQNLVPESLLKNTDAYKLTIYSDWELSNFKQDFSGLLVTVASTSGEKLYEYNTKLTLAKSYTNIFADIVPWVVNICLLGLLGISVLYLFAKRFGNKMAAPLIALAEKIEQGHYPVSPTGTDDELNLLAIRFDEATAQLQIANKELETRVAQRTAELESKKNDLTKTNEQLNKSINELSQSNKELDQYAYVASHDLKSPLQAVSRLAGWIEEDCFDILPDTSKDYFKMLKERIARLENLLADLLMYSRINKQEFIIEAVNLNSKIDQIIKLLDIPTNFKVDKTNCEQTIELPRIPLELVLRNLIRNSVKHHDKDHGCISVSYSNDEQYHIIRVKDDGPGIPPNLQAKAVAMFDTLKPRDEVEGSGMGLAMVDKTLKRYQGSFQIISDGKNGTEIITKWPKSLS
ncbi:ATP-binding protein [Aliikangiella sp. IMCC44653]